MKLLDKLVLKDVALMFLGGVAMFMVVYFAVFPIVDAFRYFSQGVPVLDRCQDHCFEILRRPSDTRFRWGC